MDTSILLMLIACCLLGLIPASIAVSKKRDFLAWWLFGAALFIIALPVILILPDGEEDMDGKKHCLYCGRGMLIQLDVCNHCNRKQPPKKNWQETVQAADPVEQWAAQNRE